MVNDAVLALVDELDRVLDGENMIFPVAVCIINHGSKRRGLSAAGRAGDEYQPFAQHGRARQDRRQREVFSGDDGRRNLPKHRPEAVLVIKKVGAEASDSGNLIAEVHVTRRFKDFLLRPRSDLIEKFMEALVIEDRVPRQTFQFTVDAKSGGLPCNQVQVRGPVFNHHAEELIYLGHRVQPPLSFPL